MKHELDGFPMWAFLTAMATICVLSVAFWGNPS